MIKENDEINNTKPRCKEERRAQYSDEEYNKLIDRIEKIKQNVKVKSKMIKNGMRWMMKMMN